MERSSRKVARVCVGRSGVDHQSNVMDPFVDWSFKYLFGTERNKSNLIGFLNLILESELESPIVDVSFLNNESIPLDSEGRECIFDILCKDESDTRFLIEVQNADLRYIRNRMLYYTCRLINRMGQVGRDWNYEIDKVYSICLMNFTYEKDPVLRRDFLMCEPNTQNILTDRIHIIMLQLPCLQAKSIKECTELYEKLLFLLLEMKSGMKTIEELKREVYEHGLTQEIKETFLNVLDEANLASLSNMDKAQYEARLKRYRDNHACLDYAIEKGIMQGIEKGMKKGMAEGLEKGIEKGIEKERLEIAKSMKKDGIDSCFIEKYTGLPKSEIEQL